MQTTFTSMLARGLHRSHREEGGIAREQALVQKHASNKSRHNKHVSVMTSEVVKYLAPKKGEVVVDATYGVGGHSQALKKTARITLVAIDASPTTEGVIEANFADLEKVLEKTEHPTINKIIFDLGWNLEQLTSGKGFSFLYDEPLNMSYGKMPASGFSATEIVNDWSEKVLADIIFGYGEERYARKIAKAIVERRKIKQIVSTMELAEIVKDAVPPAYRHGRIHPATKTFQALRIAVNDELKVLEKGLTAAWRHLASGGRVAVISFHSIEDRVVKQTFAGWVKKGEGKLLSKKPLTPSNREVAANPRARSAKLRVIEKICEN